MGSPDDAAWQLALYRLEQVAVQAEQALAAGEAPELGPWVAPEGLGPLPGQLRDHAQQILERQHGVLVAISSAARLSARHHDLTTRLQSGTTDAPGSVYVDVRA
jgi:hypothetical protein